MRAKWSGRRTGLWIRLAAALLAQLVFGFAFAGAASAAPFLKFQAGPLLVRTVLVFSAGALLALLALALLTFLFGRFYCSVLCPLGVFQDLVAFVSLRKFRHANPPALGFLRFLLAGLVVGSAAAGTAAGVQLFFGPYALAGRSVVTFAAGGAATFAVFVALVLWKGRVWCASVCPVGALLGLLSRRSVFRLRLGEGCVRCGRCEAACPAGAIDAASGTVDNARCLRCLRCRAVCKRVEWTFPGKPGKTRGADGRADGPPSPSRRAFILQAAGAAAGLAGGVILAKTGRIGKIAGGKAAKLDPTRCMVFQNDEPCGRCARACPVNAIALRASGAPRAPKEDVCISCGVCGAVCPTGAMGIPRARKADPGD